MELSVLLHHRDFLRGAAFQQRGLPCSFSLTERRFAFVIGPRHFQAEFQPVTETVGERTRLFVFVFLVFAVIFAGFWCCNSFGPQGRRRVRGGRNRRQFPRRLFR
ncbi:hypothetical protein LUZ28_27080 [Streptomyces albireticuli]|uniref:hypothetical protein n=1 Tax=Streptomyces albireticuli TaxID=1940 RepID=UPI001E5130AC|nr:hypothetical protein [Streptomyces albireticuli]MCD9165800.1 hypothetical protein [Streptomyces albireticuli]